MRSSRNESCDIGDRDTYEANQIIALENSPRSSIAVILVWASCDPLGAGSYRWLSLCTGQSYRIDIVMPANVFF